MPPLTNLLRRRARDRPDGDKRATANAPAHATPDALARVVREQADAQHYAGALALLRAASSSVPPSATLALAEADVLFAWGRHHEAAEVLRRAPPMPLAPDEAVRAARAFFQSGDFVEAEARARAALTAGPHPPGLAALAASLHAQGRVVDAEDAYRQLLGVEPDSVDALMGLGNCLVDQQREVEAIGHLRHALVREPRNVDAWILLGTALDRLERESEALAAFEHAAEIERDDGRDAGAQYALAAGLANAGRIGEALPMLERYLPSHPSAKAYLFYSHALLAAGRLPEGWWFNEFRWMTDYFVERKPAFMQPEWNGQALAGKRVLLHVEQGIGDTLQFLRYAPSVKALGATVFLTVRPEMRRLLTGCEGVDRLIEIGRDPVPGIDYYVHLLTLPAVFRTDLASLPGRVPYLAVPADAAARWAPRLGAPARLRVGLVWSGNPVFPGNRARSLPLAALAPLAAVEGVHFYALQKGPPAAEALAPPAGLAFTDLAPEIADLTDTAAIIAGLDVVITVCTSVAHLAGALGKEVWVLLARSADWRWLQDRVDSPWYPAARLFRQTRRGDWDGVVARVAQALHERVARGAAPPALAADADVPARAALPRREARHLAPEGVASGLCAVAQTRHGVLQYVSDGSAVACALGWYGEWLQPHLDLLSSLVKSGARVLEAGAGVGAHTIPLAARVGPAGLVIAYEADPVLGGVLRENLAAHRRRNVTVMRRRLAGGADADGVPPGVAMTETIDDLALDRVDCLKLNRGSARVLAGASATLWRLRPIVFVAVVDADEGRDVESRLRAHGYRCWRARVALYDPGNFNRRDDDIFAGEHAVALLAIPEEIEVRGALPHCTEVP